MSPALTDSAAALNKSRAVSASVSLQRRLPRRSGILTPFSLRPQDEGGADAGGGPAGPGGDEVGEREGDRDGEQHCGQRNRRLGGGACRGGEVGPGPAAG